MRQSGLLLPLFLFEFRYLPATLAPEATSVAFTKVAGRIAVLLINGAPGYPYTLRLSHIVTCFLGIVTSRDGPSGLLFGPYLTAPVVALVLSQHGYEFRLLPGQDRFFQCCVDPFTRPDA